MTAIRILVLLLMGKKLAAVVVVMLVGIVVIGAGYIRGEMTKEYRISSSVVLVALNEKDQFSSKTNVPYKTDVDIARDLADDAKYIIKSEKNMYMLYNMLK